jgi:hypothetical protein
MAVVTINIEAAPITPIYTEVLLAFDILYNEVCDNNKTPHQLDVASGGALLNASSVYDMLNNTALPGNYSDGITKANWDGIQLTNKQACQAPLPKTITITNITELNGELLIQFNYSGFTPNTIIVDRSYDNGNSWPNSNGGSIVSPRTTPMPLNPALYRLRDGQGLATSNYFEYIPNMVFEGVNITAEAVDSSSACSLSTTDAVYIVPSVPGEINVGDYLYEMNSAPYTKFIGGETSYYGVILQGSSAKKSITVSYFGEILSVQDCPGKITHTVSISSSYSDAEMGTICEQSMTEDLILELEGTSIQSGDQLYYLNGSPYNGQGPAYNYKLIITDPLHIGHDKFAIQINDLGKLSIMNLCFT